MFLLNKGMMQFVMHPYRRNDLSGTGLLFMRMYSGGPLTQTEIDYINSPAVTLTNGFFNVNNIHTELVKNRTWLTEPSPSAGLALTKKMSYDTMESIVFALSQQPYPQEGRAVGVAGLLLMAPYVTSWATARSPFIFTVGDMNSNADVKMLDINITVGKRIVPNDIIFTIDNLLGES